MFYSVAVIVAIMVLAVAFTGMCSFSRDTSENVPVQQVDEHAFLSMEARAQNYPVRDPAVPEDWKANSARREALGAGAPTIGWLIGKDGYLQLTQTDVAAAELIDNYRGNPREVRKEYDLEGYQVQVAEGFDDEVRQLRIVDLGDVRLVVTGSATDAEYDALLRAAIQAEPIDINH